MDAIKPTQTAATRLCDLGFEDVVIFDDPSFDDALIGVTVDGRAVYDYDLMVDGLIRHEGLTRDEAIEWLEYNTIRGLDYIADGPIVVNRLPQDSEVTDE